jgi:hypothetical protein
MKAQNASGRETTGGWGIGPAADLTVVQPLKKRVPRGRPFRHVWVAPSVIGSGTNPAPNCSSTFRRCAAGKRGIAPMSQTFLKRLRPRQTPWRARRAAQGIAHKPRAVSDTGPGKLAKAARANLDPPTDMPGCWNLMDTLPRLLNPPRQRDPNLISLP